jgi:hypothetical protein
LSPVEILSHLGFKIPNDGVELNSDDSCLYVESLRLLGRTIDISVIPDSELSNLKIETLRLLSKTIDTSTFKDTDLNNFDPGFARLVRVLREGKTIEHNHPDMDVSIWLRSLVASCLSTIYKPNKV